MEPTIDIIKHGGKKPTERFMREKLHASIVISCLSIKTPEGFAIEIADKVCDFVESWLKNRPVVTSGDIRVVASRQFKLLHPDAAYIYEHNKVII